MKLKRAIVILCLGIVMAWADKSVLVLHSYHHGLDWTDSISRGLIDTTAKSSEKINLYFEYLDTKRNISPTFLTQTFHYFTLKHKNSQFDAIVVSDNDALVFMNTYGNILFPSVPVIFCGINHFSQEMVSNLFASTGVEEVVDYKQTLLLAQKLFPKRTKVLIALDDTLTANKILKEIKEVEKSWGDSYTFYYLWDFSEQALDEFMHTHKDNYILYPLAYNRNKTGAFFGYEEIVSQLQKLFGKEVPIFGSWSFFIGKGIVGGALTTGFTQGKMAGELLMEVLQGKDANTLPMRSNINDQSITLDYNMMQHFGLKKPTGMKATYINEPIDFLTRYKVMLLVLLGIFAVFIVSLSLIIWRNKTKNKMLEELNASLEESVEIAVQEIQKNEKLFRFIADSAPYVIFIVDSNYVLTYINDKVKSFFGHEPEDVLGILDFRFLPAKYQEEILKNLEKIKKDSLLEYMPFEIYCERIGKYFKTYMVPMNTAEGTILGYRGIILDITEEKEKLDTLTQEAQTDHLTGMLNRNTFEKELRKLFDASKISSDEVCVMMLDVDYFKKVNDVHGHLVGDFVLKKIAHMLQTQVRKTDYIFRYGGEEFAIVLPLISLEKALELAQKIREFIANQIFNLEDTKTRITLSIGVSMFGEMDEDIHSVVKRADAALYKAKQKGRNRVEIE